MQNNTVQNSNKRQSKRKRTIIVGVFVSMALAAIITLAVLFSSRAKPSVLDTEVRITCIPEGNETETKCEKKGCIWNKNAEGTSCYLPKNYGYHVISTKDTTQDQRSFTLKRNTKTSLFGGDIEEIVFTYDEINDNVLHFKFYDPKKKRYEVPVKEEWNIPEGKATNPRYIVNIKNEEVFSFQIIRKSTQTILWDTSVGGLTFADKFLQIATKLPSEYIYGFGENRHDSFKHNLNYKTWPMFARDQGVVKGYEGNHYGVHPFYTCMEKNGMSHGVLLVNSNAMDYSFQPLPALILRSIGGILDFYMFFGPTPENVIQQYTKMIGRPFIPPYWSLGFQISRWGYDTLENMKKVVDRNRNASIPYDVQVGDLDYMEDKKDFTYDKVKFKDFPAFIEDLHSKGMRLIIILDPAIVTNDTYYDVHRRGLKNDVYINWPQNSSQNDDDTISAKNAMLGWVWPDGKTAFPDWFKNTCRDWWMEEIKSFHKIVKFDGLWIDMNEPANFGTNNEIPWYCTSPCWSLKCPINEWDNPPYPTYAALYNKARLSDKTICMNAIQDNGLFRHYDVHNLYGWKQAPPTLQAAQESTEERSLVISRSTYPGSGKHAGHWLGDNLSNWPEMHHSIIGMLEFNLFGIPYIGADICGFFENTTEELCTRWQQLGAFYPFSRNHNTKGPIDQDPAVWNENTTMAMRKALEIRYYLLPYLYTLFFNAHTLGNTVVRPLFHEFFDDVATYSIDQQFLWGPALMIAPVLEKGKEKITTYFPKDFWYDYYTYAPIGNENFSASQEIDAPLDKIPLFIRGGFIIPAQKSSTTTKLSRMNNFTLIIALAYDEETNEPYAEGELFWDDGYSKDTYEEKRYNYYKFHFRKNLLNIVLEKQVEHLTSQLYIDKIIFLGVRNVPKYISYNSQYLQFNDFREIMALEVSAKLPMDSSSDIFFLNEAIPLETELNRIDCDPDENNTEHSCINRGCAWNSERNNSNIPQCYYPNSGYTVEDIFISTKDNDFEMKLKKSRISNFFNKSEDFEYVYVSVFTYNKNFVEIKISTDKERFTIPDDFIRPINSHDKNYLYKVEKSSIGEDFTLTVFRSLHNKPIWKTIGGLVFSEQFLELTVELPSPYVYGFGENTHQTLHHDLNFKTWGMFARDQPPGGDGNLYGVHPFYICLESNGNSHGVFFANTHAMEYKFTPKPSLTIRSLGGNLHFFIYLGPTPSDVILQYSEMLGDISFLPPYWSLGFQLSRYGYGSLEIMKKVLDRNEANSIPVDAIYGDIDYLDNNKMFTYDKTNFRNLPEYIKMLKEKGIHFVSIFNPTLIANESDYKPFEEIENAGAFIQNVNGSLMLGQVWPKGPVAFQDVLHVNISNVLHKLIEENRNEIDYDGLWLDMNEPANFATYDKQASTLACSDSKFDNPPYKPRSLVGSTLSEKTICMSSLHNGTIPHYHVHNIYGRLQLEIVYNILDSLSDKNMLTISRSTYPGSSRFGGHWLGDNDSSWKSMRQSIIGCLEFNIFSLPYVGADICGYFGNATEELCARWMQLGAFYPFSRNHNGLHNKDQDPAAFGHEFIFSIKEALEIRYSLLPYLYTEFVLHQQTHSMVMTSLFFKFPYDGRTRKIDRQFLFGSAIMVIPVLEKNKVTVSAYFPYARWFDFRTGEEIFDSGRTITLDAPKDVIPLFILGGNIIPLQKPALNTKLSSKNPFSLIIAPDLQNNSNGILYYNDKESKVNNSEFYVARFSYTQDELNINVTDSYKLSNPLFFDEIRVLGIAKKPREIEINPYADSQFTFNKLIKELLISGLQLPLNKSFRVKLVY